MTEAGEERAVAPITIFTIGFTGKTAQEFFEALRGAGVRKVVDIRLKNASQFAGFTKAKDLEYFLRTIAGITYVHLVEFAPTQEMLSDYRNGTLDWAEYERQFALLLEARAPAALLSRDGLDRACLLCSEPAPDQCHRRHVAEYLRNEWGSVEIIHL